QLAGAARAGSPDPPPEVALIVEVQAPSLIGVSEGLVFGPVVLMSIELQDLPAAPVRHPDVVVLVRHDAVRNGIGAGHRKDGEFLRGWLELGDRTAKDPSDVEIELGVHCKRLHPLDVIPDHIGGITGKDDIPFLGLWVEPIDVADTTAFSMLWHPDHSI